MTSILVLDDRADNRQLMTAVLGGRYTVIEAESGAQALDLIRGDPPDLVIADVLMPEMDGYEFVRELRRHASSEHTRVIFCTATYAEDEIRALATACGVSQILFKPCEPAGHLRRGGRRRSPTAGRRSRRWRPRTSTSTCASSTGC